MTTSVKFNSIANLVQSVLTGLLIFILYRYVSIKLGVSTLGVWSVVLATVSTSRLADFGLGAAVTKFVASNLAKGNAEKAAESIETSLIAVGIFALFFLIAVNPVIHYLMTKIFHGSDLDTSFKLLPYALVSLWLVLTSSIVLSGFDGSQKMIIRSVIVVIGQLLMLISSVILIPKLGVVGLAIGQLIQGTFLLVTSWIFLRKILRTLHVFPYQFLRPVFNQLFKYGVNVQISGIVIMLFDPLTKALMAKFGGASMAGLFEIANQIVLKIRALMISANQAIIPKVAHLTETNPSVLGGLYSSNMKMLLIIMMLTYSSLMIWIDPLATFVLKDVSSDFYLIYYCILLGWFINTIATPAYFFNLGIGDVKVNTYTHVVMGLSNLFIGLIAGFYFGWRGVLFSYVFSLSFASLYLVIAFQKNHNIRFKALDLPSLAELLIVTLTAIAFHYFIEPGTDHIPNLFILTFRYIVPTLLLSYGFFRSELCAIYLKKTWPLK